jgi:hypothetical protein
MVRTLLLHLQTVSKPTSLMKTDFDGLRIARLTIEDLTLPRGILEKEILTEAAMRSRIWRR